MKRYVLQALKVLIALVVAVALAKIAFFPGQAEGSAADISPSYAVTTQTVAATVGDVSNTVDVTGKVVEDAPLEAKSTLSGVVDSLATDTGATVAEGDPLVYLKHVEPQQPRVSVGEDGTSTETPVADKVTWATVYAPTSGTVTYKVMKNQETAVATVVATVAPGTYSATGTITPSQQYRLTNAPTTATLTVKGGPSPFECTRLAIGSKATTATTTDPTGSVTTTQGDGTTVEIRCAVPTDQKVFPGLPVTIGINAGSATGVVILPLTAVEGSTTTGNVWVVTDPSDPDTAQKRQVSLGINDGTSVQVTEGLAEGETVLEFVPGKNTTRTGKPGTCDENACYDENGEEYL